MDFLVLGPGGNCWEADLMAIIQYCQETYFPDARPISSAEFIDDLDGPSRLLPQIDKVEVKRCLSPFQKLCRLLVLHELIHNKLFRMHGAPQEDTGEEFRAEVNRLWDVDAYVDLL
jgi:hypothetical protein